MTLRTFIVSCLGRLTLENASFHCNITILKLTTNKGSAYPPSSGSLYANSNTRKSHENVIFKTIELALNFIFSKMNHFKY